MQDKLGLPQAWGSEGVQWLSARPGRWDSEEGLGAGMVS